MQDKNNREGLKHEIQKRQNSGSNEAYQKQFALAGTVGVDPEQLRHLVDGLRRRLKRSGNTYRRYSSSVDFFLWLWI